MSATFWLLQAPDSLRRQSHREPDGTGLGYYAADVTPRVDKQPVAAFSDRAFAQEARTVTSKTFVAHIRFASTGALALRNTHPFEQRGRLLAHNGVIGSIEAFDARLGAERSLVLGDTDSERFFALITREIDACDGDVAAGIAAAARWVAATLPVLSLNLVLIDAAALWALRYPDTHELYVLERPAGASLDQVSSHRTHVVAEPACPTVVVASEVMDADPGWRLLAPGELLHVDASLNVSSSIVIEGPPAHPLSLADLAGHAR
ncbi:MAG TPA: class II glutamine amidotransferase, partial [Solirubrobacteraceae bacterium]|nr:class II glutamine amidotransferase [Solirubrobacteraceae bacterium]